MTNSLVPDQAEAFTELQQQVVDLRNNELLDASAIAKRLKKDPAQIRKLLRHPKVIDKTLDAVTAMLQGSATDAAKTLLDLLDHRSGYVKLQAAAQILDRAGIIKPEAPTVKVKNVTINIGFGLRDLKSPSRGGAKTPVVEN